MSTRNYPLWIGAVLTGFFLLLAVIGPRLAPHDPLEVFDDVIFIGDETYIPSRRPLAPLTLDQFLLGNDNAGRDLYSRLLWAIRPTLILCFFIAAIRLIMGITLGMLAGWGGGITRRVLDVLIDICLAVPILLFALAVLSFLGNQELPSFVLALVLTGWAGTAVYVRNSTLLVKQAPFIEGARAVGVPPLRILRYHVLPQLWPALPALISFELAATLLVVAELGFLGMFIGEAFVIIVEDPRSAGTIPAGLTAGYPELAQMLSDFWSKMLRSPWEVALVGTAIFMVIFAFNMLGEGLRRHMDVTRPRQSRRRRAVEVEGLELPHGS